MSDTIDPGEGYRLLHAGEEILAGDQHYRMSRGWSDVVSVVGEEYNIVDYYPVRRRLDAHPRPSELDTLRDQVDALTAERDDLRQKLATAQSDNGIIRNANINLQSDLDAASKALNELGCTKCEIADDIAQCIHDLATRWRTDMTEQRACEVVTQLKRDGRLEWRDDHCDWVVAGISDNWQCRPSQPKPVTLTVTCPLSQREAVEAAIRAAGGSV